MIIELIIALLLGCTIGTFTGLFPGIHINLISASLISLIALPSFSQIPPIPLIIFIVSMSITHTFLDFIPSIYLGAPEEDSFLSILPGHNLLLQGQGHKAVLMTLKGSLYSLIPIIIFIPIFLLALGPIEAYLKPIFPYILIFFSLFLILRENNYFLATTIFLLSGFLGFSALNLPIKSPVLPLLTGLFGISTLLVSLGNKTKIPKQSITFKTDLSFSQTTSSLLSSAITAPISSFLPGFGSGQAALLSSEISNSKEDKNPEQFLFTLGSINTIVMSLSFFSLYALQRTRTGSALAISEITSLSTNQLTLIFLTIILTSFLAYLIGKNISKAIAININKFSYKKISISLILFLIVVNFFLTNLLGLFLLIVSSSLGIFCILSNSRRTNLMGSLLIPTILYYLI